MRHAFPGQFFMGFAFYIRAFQMNIRLILASHSTENLERRETHRGGFELKKAFVFPFIDEFIHTTHSRTCIKDIIISINLNEEK